jgi:CO/xanthine dehydrogenase Mo-binding subunit
MTRRRILTISAAIALLIAMLVTAGTFYVSHALRQSAITTAMTWARLAPLPPSAQNLKVETMGSMFTREFEISFHASPQVIQQWLASSPGTASATQSALGAVTTYSITPGGGAQFAEVKVDAGTGSVVIHTYWS